MTRNHFSKHPKSPYFVSSIQSKDEVELEKKIEDMFKYLITIPRRFWAGIKKISWPL